MKDFSVSLPDTGRLFPPGLAIVLVEQKFLSSGHRLQSEVQPKLAGHDRFEIAQGNAGNPRLGDTFLLFLFVGAFFFRFRFHS